MGLRGVIFVAGICYFFVLFLFIYVFLCGGSKHFENETCQRILTFFQKIFLRVFTRFFSCCQVLCCCPTAKKVGSYCMYERNPFMQLFYLFLFTINLIFFFILVYPQLDEYVNYISPFRIYVGFSLVLSCYVSFFVACYTNPGIITKKNLAYCVSSFKFDNVLYHPGTFCKTCKIVRPARSKHCRYTKRCVSKFDHFCPWINNTVGEFNYRWFHLFLICNLVTTVFGTVLYVNFVYAVVHKNNLMHSTFVTRSGRKVQAGLAVVIQYLLNHYIYVIAQGILIGAMMVMLIFFEGFHVTKILLKNTTTNESFKWDELERQYRSIVRSPLKYRKNEYLKDIQIKAVERLFKEGKDIVNPYDKGWLHNIKEVIYPPTLRRQRKKFSEEKVN